MSKTGLPMPMGTASLRSRPTRSTIVSAQRAASCEHRVDTDTGCSWCDPGPITAFFVWALRTSAPKRKNRASFVGGDCEYQRELRNAMEELPSLAEQRAQDR